MAPARQYGGLTTTTEKYDHGARTKQSMLTAGSHVEREPSFDTSKSVSSVCRAWSLLMGAHRTNRTPSDDQRKR